MSKLEIHIDTRPYLPDIYTKQDIYSSFDRIDINNYISINSQIFIFNLNSKLYPNTSIYNDPKYLLFGIEQYPPYIFSSTYFFNYNSNTINYYEELYSTNILTPYIQELLNNIGYNISDIDYDSENPNFCYYELLISDSISKIKRTVIYIYFGIKSLNNTYLINYNNYKSTIFYKNYNTTFNKNSYWNVFIYPFINIIEQCSYDNLNINYNFDINKMISSKSKHRTETVDFDDRENIKYLDKLDYKYFENREFMLSNTNKLEQLQNYSFNIKNYEKYMQSNNYNINNIFISLNEISRQYYMTMDFINKNSYTNNKLNTKYINNNISFSNCNNKYSFSMSNKFSSIFYDNTTQNYSCYNYDVNNYSTIYQLNKNYHIDCYFDINDLKQDSLTIINCYLYKIFISIDPKLINKNYMLSNDVIFKIDNLFNTNNIFDFGTNINKFKLHIIGDINYTDTYYINKYKISYSTKKNIFCFNIEDDNENNSNTECYNDTLNYIITFSIAFYNSKNINIVNTGITKITDDLGFINYTNQELQISLNPTIYSSNSIFKLYEDIIKNNLNDIKKYRFLINYHNITDYKFKPNNRLFNHYYFVISNMVSNLKTIDNNFYNNAFNILINKINNFIINIINLNDNYTSLKNNSENINSIMYISVLLDNNISISTCENKLVYLYSYLSEIQPEYCNQDSYNYKNYYNISQNNNFVRLPSGYYKVLNYTNIFSKILITPIDDNLVSSIKLINQIINYNFCLMIKLPNNLFIDDSFYVSNTDSKYWETNYGFNTGYNESFIFLVLSDSNGNPYKNERNIIYGIKLFNYYNNYTNLNITNVYNKTKINLFINNYINLYQMNFILETYNEYSEESQLILDIDNTNLKLHNQEFLKEIVLYDFKRFQNSYDIDSIKTQYSIYDKNISNSFYNNKLCLNSIKYDFKKIICLKNLEKILLLAKKCKSYLCIIKNNIILSYLDGNKFLINLINYNINKIKQLDEINYNLNITYCITGKYATKIYEKISFINLNNTLENINNFITDIDFIIDYINTKIYLIQGNLNMEYKNCNTDISEIINYIFYYKYNYYIDKLVLKEIDKDITNIKNNVNIDILNYLNLTEIQKKSLLELLMCYIYSYFLNIKKIDELLNLVKLTYYNKSIDPIIQEELDDNVLKDHYIYNTNYYNIQLGIKSFNIFQFFNDYKCIILENSSSLDPEIQIIYTKAINEDIIDYINNSIINYDLINNKIIQIYKYIYNLPSPPGLLPLNIYDLLEIGNFYYLLSEFKKNYNNLFKIINENNIKIFYEFDSVYNFFEELVYSVEELLFYSQLRVELLNTNNLTQNIYISDNLIKITNDDKLFLYITNFIKNMDNIFLYYDYNTLNNYLQFIKTNLTTNLLENNVFMDILLNKKIIIYGSYDIIPYQDLNILTIDFNYSSFNFNKQLINLCQIINYINTFFNDYYYNYKDMEFCKNLINYNYLVNSFVYLNINNNIIPK